MSFYVLGTGSARPGRVVTNDELSTFLDTDDEWISTRTGISTRRVCTSESVADLAEQAARNAIDSADIAVDSIDLVICSTVSADFLSPSLACLVAERLGISCMAFDVNGACAGFIYALDVADGYLARGRAQTALVIASEKMTHVVDWTDRATCVLFGDGAGAQILVTGSDSPLYTKLASHGTTDAILVPSVAGNSPFSTATQANTGLTMRGREVFRFAVTSVCEEVQQACESAHVELAEIDHFVFHQANGRILDAAIERLGVEAQRVARSIADTGNISSACIPLTLDYMNKEQLLHDGDLVLLSGFGAGLVTGTMLLRWGAPHSG